LAQGTVVVQALATLLFLGVFSQQMKVLAPASGSSQIPYHFGAVQIKTI